MKYLLGIFCLLFSIVHCLAQQLEPKGTIGTAETDSVPAGLMPLDTPAHAVYVFIGNEKKFYTEEDTFTWSDVGHHPLPFGYSDLGNLGSPYRSLMGDLREPIGFSTGWFQYDPYYIHENSFRYYGQEIPVAKIKYSQNSKDDTYLTLEFGERFAHGISLSITYNRINQIGEFANQHQKNTALGIGVWHNAPSGRYDAFYNLISNAAIGQENGGITQPDSLGTDLNPDDQLETFISDGLTTHKHRIFLTKQILHVLGDSSSFGIDLWAKVKFQTGLFKYVDETISDSNYYSSLFLLEDRGIRQFVFTREHEESIGISLPWKSTHSTIDGSLRYRNIRLEQEPLLRHISELYFDASAAFQWIEPLKLSGALSLGLGQAQGNYSFKAVAELTAGKLGVLSGHWYLQSRRPYLVESSLWVNQLPVYNRDFNDPFNTEIAVQWKVEKQNFEAGIQWKVLDDFIFFDSLALPQQIHGSFSQKQFYISKGFDFKWAGFIGSAVWQPDTREELALPDKLFKGSVYGRIRIFKKKLTIMPGIDLTYYSSFTGISYFPVNGIYHLTYREPIPDYLRLDAGIGFNINFIKAFVRMEDIQGLIEKRALYLADFYPQYRGYFRFGLSAGFYN